MDSTIKKVVSAYSPKSEMGEICLVSGKGVAMRLWREEPGEGVETQREYETVGYVIQGRAELEVEDQMVRLEAGDSWLVPKMARHRYRILERFEAVEATSPPYQVHGRDQAPR
jgi:mannose-6-phosphate isomerase-like protein (cupin superfamily)